MITTMLTREVPVGPPPSLCMTVMDQLPTMVSVWNADGRNEFANRALLSWLGAARDEVRGRPWCEVLRPGLGGLDEAHVAMATSGERVVFDQVVARGANQGQTYRVELVPYLVPGQPTGVLCTVTDISELAELRQRRELAVDFYDTLLQELFAIGLMVTVAARADGAVRTDMKDALTGLDHAVRALRQAIRSLRWRDQSSGTAA